MFLHLFLPAYLWMKKNKPNSPTFILGAFPTLSHDDHERDQISRFAIRHQKHMDFPIIFSPSKVMRKKNTEQQGQIWFQIANSGVPILPGPTPVAAQFFPPKAPKSWGEFWTAQWRHGVAFVHFPCNVHRVSFAQVPVETSRLFFFGGKQVFQEDASRNTVVIENKLILKTQSIYHAK